MVEPIRFRSNEETLADNQFQSVEESSFEGEGQRRALAEFLSLRDALTVRGVQVTSVRDIADNNTPDSIFPNNWFSTHSDGELVLYPMKTPSRRRERRPDLVASLKTRYSTLVDLTAHENEGAFLEGTGALVLDRVHRIAYVSLSQRAHASVISEWARRMRFEVISFSTTDDHNFPIYHTNVMLNIGEHFAVLCSEVIRSASERSRVLDNLSRSGRTVIDLSFTQLQNYCGNVLELKSTRGDSLIVMSTRAYTHFNPSQINTLQKGGEIVHLELGTIERFGGGSARCMLAELF